MALASEESDSWSASYKMETPAIQAHSQIGRRFVCIFNENLDFNLHFLIFTDRRLDDFVHYLKII